MKAMILAVLLALVSVPAVHAAAYWEIEQTLQAGGSVTVGSDLAAWQISQLISIGHERVTVHATGFPAWQVDQFLSAGGAVLVDASFAAWQISQFISSAKQRVKVEAAGFPAWQVEQFRSAGATIVGVPGNDHPAYWQLEQALDQGQSITIGNELAAWQVTQLCQKGGARVTVRAAGFAQWQLSEFARYGANIQYQNKREAAFAEIYPGR